MIKRKTYLFLNIFTIITLCTISVNAEQDILQSDELKELRQTLTEAGFTVRFNNPPVQGAYGLFNSKKKIIWIAPITKEIGILRQTFIHEAVHAAQACKNGKIEPIGWSLDADKAVEAHINSVLYRKYPPEKHDVEREAFMMQAQSDASKKIKNALIKYC